MVSVKVLYEEGEEEQAKEILRALENIHRKRAHSHVRYFTRFNSKQTTRV